MGHGVWMDGATWCGKCVLNWRRMCEISRTQINSDICNTSHCHTVFFYAFHPPFSLALFATATTTTTTTTTLSSSVSTIHTSFLIRIAFPSIHVDAPIRSQLLFLSIPLLFPHNDDASATNTHNVPNNAQHLAHTFRKSISNGEQHGCKHGGGIRGERDIIHKYHGTSDELFSAGVGVYQLANWSENDALLGPCY